MLLYFGEIEAGILRFLLAVEGVLAGTKKSLLKCTSKGLIHLIFFTTVMENRFG